jgi:hypothetical protein
VVWCGGACDSLCILFLSPYVCGCLLLVSCLALLRNSALPGEKESQRLRIMSLEAALQSNNRSMLSLRDALTRCEKENGRADSVRG